MTRVLVLTSALLLATGLAGCGKVGRLERPGPLFGAGHNTAQGADDAQNPRDPTRPVDTIDPRDRDIDPAPARTLPIPGTNPSATDVAPPSALPDPYADPRR